MASISNDRRLMIAVFSLALGFRVLYSVLFSEQTDLSADRITADLNYASKIASGFEWIGTPVSPRAPGYPIVLALFYLLGAKQLWLVVLLQAALGALTVVFAYRMALHLLGSVGGILATLWYALSINHIRAVGEFQRDILGVFLIVLLVFLLTRPFQRMAYGVITGILYGALIHVEPLYMLLFPMFAILILLKTKHPILNVQYLFLFASALILFCVPWAIRNNAVYGQPIPVGLEATRVLRPAKIATGDSRQLSELEEKIVHASRSGRIKRNVVEFWRFARFRDSSATHPVTGSQENLPAWSARYNAVSIVTFGILLPFFIIGIITAIRTRHRTALLFVFVVVYYALVRAYFDGNVRTRIPAEPFIVMLAFYGILVLKYRFVAPPTKEQLPPT